MSGYGDFAAYPHFPTKKRYYVYKQQKKVFKKKIQKKKKERKSTRPKIKLQVLLQVQII
jgi:hypothetical protein